MSKQEFKPTAEQEKIIRHSGSAFVAACPGAGKTHVMVERARLMLTSGLGGRGVAFLSFTRAAITELEIRLRREGILSSSPFPHFIGTFDSFIWQFFVAPFGIPGVSVEPRLVPDMDSRVVQPYEKAQPLPLSCFDRATSKIDDAAAGKLGFEVTSKKPAVIKAYETLARKMRTRFRDRGELDFDDARTLALVRLRDAALSDRLSLALSARFCEILVDEAQDCNPDDLEIIRWLRATGIATKVVCDPHQSIYRFRGGLTDQLFAFQGTFDVSEQLPMRGNFRSSSNICKAIAMLRAPAYRIPIDEALGEYQSEKEPVYVLSYGGASVPSTIGREFVQLLTRLEIDVSNAPVLAATKKSSANAIGQTAIDAREDLTFRLAKAVGDFAFAFDTSTQASVIEELHTIILELEGRISRSSKTYHQYLVSHGTKPDEWRPQMLSILRTLKYDPALYADANAWHDKAKQILAPIIPKGNPSISQQLRRNKDIESVLGVAPPTQCPPAKTIHSVKGKEFPAVCVVTVPKTLGGILDFLQTGAPAESAEEARKLYVAASRAQRLLALATPRNQSKRLVTLLRTGGCEVTVLSI